MQANIAETQSKTTQAFSDTEILGQYDWVATSLANRISAGEVALRKELEQIGRTALIEVGRMWKPGKQALSSFVYPRVRGAMLDYLRKEHDHAGLVSLDEPIPSSDSDVPLSETIASDQDNPEEALIKNERDFLIGRALESLPAKERDLLVMKFYENADDDAIAASLGVHRTTAMRNVRSALDSLKSKLEELGAI